MNLQPNEKEMIYGVDGSNKYSLGIDIGYSSVKLSLINCDDEIEFVEYAMHKGKVKEILKKSLQNLLEKYDLTNIEFGGVTGSGYKILSEIENINNINEVAAIVEGSSHINKDVRSIIEIGGQSAKYVTQFNENDKSRIKISMNSNCSAGTGSFLEEQVSRLNLKLEDYSVYASRAKSIPRIAGRCSVFAKTDITHHQQEGVSVEDILLGLAYAVIKNYKVSVMKKLTIEKPILFVGGVAHNKGIIAALNDVLNLSEGELVIPDHFCNVGALGAAIIAKRDEIKIDLEQLLISLEQVNDFYEDNGEVELPLLKSFGNGDGLNKHVCKVRGDHYGILECYLGVDVGSTSTNLVLADEDNCIISYKYLRTLGNPVLAIRKGLYELKQEFGDDIKIIGVGTTGSGRYMIGRLIGADVIKDEITAQAKAAVVIDDSVDTIFEIGGQDSKYISLENGVVRDFQMNKICAAGTGSFIEEQVKKFNIPIDEFGNIAINSAHPINLGQRCTVFIETSIAANLSRGAKIDDIASGLCYSIVKNYLNRVVGQKKIGDKIFLQGGIAYNQGVVNAFRALTGKDIHVPPFFSVTGALGAAILAKEEIGGQKTRFKGFDIETDESFVGTAGGYEPKVSNKSNFNDMVEKLIFEGYDSSVDCNKEIVGIPRALFTYGMFPMFNEFFKELGFNVIMSDPTNEETIRRGQEYSLDETCYPIKLINGHVAELVEKNVDYIFFPDLYTVPHPGSQSRQNYGCAYMQLAFKMVKRAMELENAGIKLLSPTIAFSLGQEFMMKTFLDLGKQLGKGPEQIGSALKKGMMAFHSFEKRIEENGKNVVKGLNPNEKAFVIISKTYGVADPTLNMGIPDKLMEMGHQVISFYDLPEGDVSKEHPNMYWPFGQHILEAAQIVKQHPNLYAIFLTHHGCGPDTVFSHYFSEIMDGKPYLNIEVDEHSSSVGVITRVEAFINSLNKIPIEKAHDMAVYVDKSSHEPVNIMYNLNELEEGVTLYLPHMYPYSEIFREILVKREINAKVLPPTNNISLDMGRKHTITNEYFSLTALLGDVLKKLNDLSSIEGDIEDGVAFFIPQLEGAEVDGQYNRLLRTKLDDEGFRNVDIVSPFIEDLLCEDEENLKQLYLALLAGDIVRIAPKKYRDEYLDKIFHLIRENRFDINHLMDISRDVYEDLKIADSSKRIFAVGDPLVLFNEYMNNFTLSDIEDKGHGVVYCPFSEYMWVLWSDFVDQNGKDNKDMLQQRLDKLKNYINAISRWLSDESPFEEDLHKLLSTADKTTGYYAGANGRYREAKTLGDMRSIDGIISVASMYENTGIALNILHKGFETVNSKPVLNLTFDGNKNENDETKVESFLYYV